MSTSRSAGGQSVVYSFLSIVGVETNKKKGVVRWMDGGEEEKKGQRNGESNIKVSKTKKRSPFTPFLLLPSAHDGYSTLLICVCVEWMRIHLVQDSYHRSMHNKAATPSQSGIFFSLTLTT